MPTLTIPNVPEVVHDRLMKRAALAKRSMEAEVRDILAQTTAQTVPDMDLAAVQDWVAEIYAGSLPSSPSADLIAERRQEAAAE